MMTIRRSIKKKPFVRRTRSRRRNKAAFRAANVGSRVFEPLAMEREECGIGRNGVRGQMHLLARIVCERGFHRVLRQEILQAFGDQEPEFVVEGDQPLVECGVVEAVEGDAIADVEAFGLVAGPGQDVGGDEEFADGQAGEGAAVVVVVEHGVAEVSLPAPLLGGSDRLGFATRRAGCPPDARAGDDLGGFGIGVDEEGVEAFLTEGDEFGGVGVEFVPHLAVESAGSLEALDAPEFERGIERSEVAQLHRDGAGGSSEPPREIDDDRLPLVELPEAELVIEIEDDQQFVTGPSLSGGHGRIVEEARGRASGKSG